MNDITCLDYESESTEDWVCSGMISVKMPVVGREIHSIWLLSVFVFPSVNVFSEGDRAEADEKHSCICMKQAKRWRRVWEPSGREGPITMFSGGPDHPPTECDYETTPPLNVVLRTPPTECSFENTPHWMWLWDHPPTECDFETTPHRM